MALKDLVTTIHKQIHSEPTPLSDYLPEVPHDLCDLVYRAMAREPADRPSASEMERELRALLPELGNLDGPAGSGLFDALVSAARKNPSDPSEADERG